ncbi:glycosyltransferase [Enterococcus faecium]|uniref:glycosyltransferase n=3 Tax=Enterococcus TaxID=1350 RepID=UPI0011171DEF|nr:glycosyltransferase [Enterococcus faecium]EME3517105.1 hypothetical protein [Enterococcus faecium]MEB4787184.1 glycosyltransferase [Enterococcus sp. E4-150]QDA38077.1 glycosyltransferase family 4 protein [Enterococcus faecium]
MKKNNKRAVIISFYRWWYSRQVYFANWLNSNGYDVDYYTADFDHISKEYNMGEKLPDIGHYIHVPAYKKNISINRIISNMVFAKKILNKLKKNKPDVVICLIPSNFLGVAIKSYRKINPKATIIIDVLDMWPESLPITKQRVILKPIMSVWKKMRTRALLSSDGIIYECNLFKNEIEESINLKNSDVLYLQKGKRKYNVERKLLNEINFAYVGSINSIIDIDRMIDLLDKVNRKKNINLVIIGCGDHEQYFISLAKEKKINVKFYGPIFDDDLKHQILSRCHFGLNVMKNTLKIGLTTKSMDYLCEGLPLINSVGSDTMELVKYYNAGLNLNELGDDNCIEKLCNMNNYEYENLMDGAKKMFDNNFSAEIYEKNVDNILKKII